MAPARLKAAFGGRVVFNGCIDTHHWLIEGTPDLARIRTREVLGIVEPGLARIDVERLVTHAEARDRLC